MHNNNHPKSAISVSGLVKTFGDVRALDNIDLHIPEGMIFGILGPNGAGKTTLLRVLATLLKPSAGSVSVMGHDLNSDAHAVRRCISMTGQYASLDDELTGRENLILLAKLLGFRSAAAKRADALLQAFELSDAAQRQVKKYSGGMRRRLDIAASLVTTPGILFLDEPTTGLDPTARKNIWQMIRALAEQGVTILLTTQYLEEAEQLAERIAVINHGKKIAEGSVRELKAATGLGFLHVTLADAGQIDAAKTILAKYLPGSVHQNAEGAVLSGKANSPGQANQALSHLFDAGIAVESFSLTTASLEEVFFALTGHGMDDEEKNDESNEP